MPPEGTAARPNVLAAEDANGTEEEAATEAEPATAEAETETEGSAGGLVGYLASAAEPVASVVEPIMENVVMPVANALSTVIDAATSALGVKDVINEVRTRLEPEPLPNLYELYPEAHLASPRELGFRFVPIEEIKGTAVAGAAQRGLDFRPLPPFRGSNWEARWRRIKEAHARLQPLPPVDLIKFDGVYWVVDGHNRVAATIDGRGVGVDAMIVELVPLDGQASEAPSSVLAFIGDAGALRTAAEGLRPAVGTRVAQPDMPLSRIEGRRETGGRRSRGGRKGNLPANGTPSTDTTAGREATEKAETPEKGTQVHETEPR